MKAQNTFDLPSQVGQWKSRLASSAQMDVDAIAELESHLLDEMDSLKKSQLNDEERFIIAQHRIGSETTLVKAFKGENRFNFQKVSWFGQAFMFLLSFIILSKMARIFTIDTFVELQLESQLSFLMGYLAIEIAAIGLLYLAYRKIQKVESIVKANLLSISCLGSTIILHLIQSYFFSSLSSMGYMPIISYLWTTMFYIIMISWFVIINIREHRRYKLVSVE
jgi:hypothetical protein